MMEIEIERGPKLEVNANFTDEKLAQSGAGSHNKLLIGSTNEQHAVAEVDLDFVVEHRNEDESHVNGEETINGVKHVDTLDKPTTNGETMEVTNNAVNGEGEAQAAEVSPSSNTAADAERSPGHEGRAPENKDSKITSKSHNSIEHIDGETDSIGSGKSPSKKKGFLSSGLHIRMPKLGSRASINSDISATSTASGSEVDGSPAKKKKKKGKKNKKVVNVDKNGSEVNTHATPDPSECSESVTNERVEDSSRGPDLDQSGPQDKVKDNETVSSAAPTPHLASNGEDIKEDVNKSETDQEQTRDGRSQETTESRSVLPVAEDEQASQTQTNGSVDAVSDKPGDSIDPAPPSSESTETPSPGDPSAAPSPTPASTSTPDISPTPAPAPASEPEAQEEPSAQAVEESDSPGEAPATESEQSPASSGDLPSKKDDAEVEPLTETGDKLGGLSSGEEGEEEDEGEVENEKHKKKKKRKGILNVHFPHFGAKKSKSTDSESDHAVSPKRFGWKKRKDAKSPERRDDQDEAKETVTEGTSEVTAELTSSRESREDDIQEGQQASAAIEGDGSDPAVPPPGDGISDADPSQGAPRPEEQLLAECQELVKEGGASNQEEGGDFASTDALLEEIAETITSIEKAQNLRASQAMEVNVLADASPESKGQKQQQEEDTKPNLQADLPTNVDESGISVPSAQLTLAVPSDSCVQEVSNEEKSEKPAGQDDQRDGVKEQGAAEASETQEGDVEPAKSPEKQKSPKSRGRYHLPKFHLPKVSLGGKKDKKKSPPEEGQEESNVPAEPEAEATPDQESKAADDENKGDLPDGNAEATEAVQSSEDKPNTEHEEAEPVTKTEGLTVNIIPPEVNVDISGNASEVAETDVIVTQEACSTEAAAPADQGDAVNNESASEPPSNDLEIKVDVEVAVPLQEDVEVEGDVSAPETPQVILVMNEVLSEEEDEAVELTSDEPAEEPEQPKTKPKKGRFKMPSLNIHLPKFGGSKKTYKVEKEVEPGDKDEIVEGDINGLDAVGEVEVQNVQEVNEAGEATPEAPERNTDNTTDVGVCAGGGNLSIEPDVQEVEHSDNKDRETEQLDNKVDAVKVVVAVAASSTLQAEENEIEKNVEVKVDDHTEATPDVLVNVDAEVDVQAGGADVSLEPSSDVPSLTSPASEEQVPEIIVDTPDIEQVGDAPSASVTVEEPQLPAVDEEARLKAKRKGLSLPAMHFRRPKMSKKMSRPHYFRSKKQRDRSMGSSSKVATSLPDVATATSDDTFITEEDRMARRASDIVDPKLAAAITAEHEVSSGGDTISSTNSKRGRFRFPRLHFALPWFLSPKKSKDTEQVEPEMTELKADVEEDMTEEADIPKTNLDVVMPEITVTVESVPDVEMERPTPDITLENPDSKVTVPEGNFDERTLNTTTDVEVTEIVDIQAPEITTEGKSEIDIGSADVPEASVEVSLEKTEVENTAVPDEIPAIEAEVPTTVIPDTEGGVDVSVDVSIDPKSFDVEESTNPPQAEISSDTNRSSGDGLPEPQLQKKAKKSFFPKMNLPKLNMKLSPTKTKTKGKKSSAEVLAVVRTQEIEEKTLNSQDVSLEFNAEGGVAAPDVEVGVSEIKTDADVPVKKSEPDVESPNIEANVCAGASPSSDVSIPSVEIDTQIDGGNSPKAADQPDVQNDEDEDVDISLAGTVVISYDTELSPEREEVEEPAKSLHDEIQAEVEETHKTSDLDVSSGATNEVLDIALGQGTDVEVKVDANIADENILPEENVVNEISPKIEKKKKKRKGLHMPSLSLPKFNLKHDKKGSSEKISEETIPDVANGTVEGNISIEAKTAEIDAPEVDTEVLREDEIPSKTDISLDFIQEIVEMNGKEEPPSSQLTSAVVASTVLEVSQPEGIDSPSKEVQVNTLPRNIGGDLPAVANDKDITAISVSTELAVPDVSIEACNEQLEEERPIIEPALVVEAVIPSVDQAVAESVPETNASPPSGDIEVNGELASPSVPQVDIDVSADADVESRDSSTSKPQKSKKGRMPKISLPKINLKFSPQKSGTDKVSSEDATSKASLSPEEIDKIEGSISSSQAQLSTPSVEVSMGGTENESEGTPSTKKGKYKKRIGAKLKKLRGKGKGHTTSTENVNGLGSSVSLDAELRGDGSLENGLSSAHDADISADTTLDNDTPMIAVSADLITSTPIKSAPASGGRDLDHPSTPVASMSLDNAIAVNSLPATPLAVSPMSPDTRPFWVVVAIDFGTTFSGYAYSLTREPESVHIMRKWEGGDPGVTNMKTPTTLLLTPEGEFHSFGFTARDFYHDMDHKEAMRWLFFDKFKLTLHGDPNLNLETHIKAANGQSFPAATVFEHSLRFFHDHALEELQDQAVEGEVDAREIRWVLTVPAIWKQPAKQFMRQAAYKAGLASQSRPDQLLIALEPEAASIYIRKLRMRELAPEHQSQRQKWMRSSVGKLKKSNSQVSEGIKYGTRYMVVDCGGGTVDITVHEVEEGRGTLKELHKAAGGMYGSVSIDQEFEQLLVDIFSIEFIEEFKIKRPAGWVDLMIAFEARKRNASPWKNTPLNVSLPFSFIDYFQKYHGGKLQVEDAVHRYSNRNIQWSAQGMLRFTPEGMQQLFASTLEGLLAGVDEVLSSPSLTGISYLFVVGGFAQSALLQSAIRKKFSSQLRIIIPRDLGLSILKGAVLFGLDPTTVRVRRSRLTYGVGVLNKFEPGVHPDEKKFTKDDMDWCRDVFDTFVQADESVALGNQVTRSYTPAKPSEQAIVINIYCSDRENVRFITDPGVRKCGTLHIDVADSQYSGGRRELQLTMQYGDTEIKVSALDVPTGKCVKSNIDFLNK